MAKRIPIIMTPARKATFARAHFELKLLALIFFVMAFAPFALIFGVLRTDNTNEILRTIIIPGSSGFYGSCAIQCFSMSVRNESLKKQLEFRLGLIAFLLLVISMVYWEQSHLYIFHRFSSTDYQKISYYRQLYNIDLPALLALIVMIRTIPMTLRFFKTSEQSRLVV